MLITILYVILGLIALVVLAGLFMEKSYSLSSSILINRPSAEVFDFVKHLKNQKLYSKWVMLDPDMEINYQGTDGTVGFISAWKSEDKNVGVGEQEITAIDEGKRYDVELRFKKPFEGISEAYTTTEAVSADQTRVTTVFNTRTPFPMNVMVPLLKNMLQRDMDGNAARLKAVLEGR